ncbi:MAG: hypothetical protein Fur003_0470 [Candidatus Dojkabacteria bacterium]
MQVYLKGLVVIKSKCNSPLIAKAKNITNRLISNELSSNKREISKKPNKKVENIYSGILRISFSISAFAVLASCEAI